MPKRQLEVEALLRWAYRDELTKRHSSTAESGWDHIEEYGRRGGVGPTGTGKRSVSFDQRYNLGPVHPDAVAIEQAVGALADQVIDWHASRDAIMGDWGALLSHRDILSVSTLRTAALVTMHARMNNRPQWEETISRPTWKMAERGPPRPAIVGKCRGRLEYSEGAYCPLVWEPSPMAIAAVRVDYLAWHRGLQELARTLELEAHQVLPPEAPEQPWLGGAPARRIFVIAGEPGAGIPHAPKREAPSAPPRTPRAGPVRIVRDRPRLDGGA